MTSPESLDELPRMKMANIRVGMRLRNTLSPYDPLPFRVLKECLT